MNLQEKILSKFKQKYPNLTLREIAELTQINHSRVFRILNGYEMKLSEYQAFHNLIKDETNQLSSHLKLYELYLNGLRSEKREELEVRYKKFLQMKQYLQPLSLLNVNNINLSGVKNA